MDEVEEEEKTAKDWARIILPRALKAAASGFLMGGEILLLLYLSVLGSQFLGAFPLEQSGFSYFLAIFIGFEIIIQLLYGTIFQYALSMTRTLISMIILVLITEGGIMNITVQSSPQMPLPPGISVVFTVDFKVVLGASLLLSLLSIVKNLLQAIEFLSEREEEPVIPPELP